MKKAHVLGFFTLMILLSSIAYSFETNSSTYSSSIIVSSGGDEINSSTYSSYTALGIISGIMNSSTYSNLLGFFYTWLLADGQTCSLDSQCQGSYCCSNSCSSSACSSGSSSSSSSSGGGGGGGSGGGGFFVREEKIQNFSVTPASIILKVALGEVHEENVIFRNTGELDMVVSLALENLEMISLAENLFNLNKDKSFESLIKATGERVGVYTGNLIAQSEEIRKIIPIVLEVISDKILFDVTLDIPDEFLIVEPGESLRTQVSLINVGAPQNVEVLVNYYLRDFEGNVLHEESETFAVEQQTSYPKSFEIPEELEEGKYALVVEVLYADSFAVSSKLFDVKEKKSLMEIAIIKNNITLIIISIILVFVLIIVPKKLPKKGKKKSKKSVKRRKKSR